MEELRKVRRRISKRLLDAERREGSCLPEALAWARGKYDYILIDSAPVNLVSESSLVARNADVTLLVIRQGTSRGAAQAARKRLSGMGVRLAGAVLNGSSLKGSDYGYYYSAYYSASSKS